MGGLVSSAFNVVKSAAPIIGTAVGTAFGGPIGGAVGGALGGAISGGGSGGGGGLVGGALQAGGSYLSGQQQLDAANQAANAQIQAARIAADAARFRPVGVSTRFGSSQFGFSPEGYLTSAGYSVSPELQAIQNRLMGATGGLLSQSERLNLDPLRQAAQSQFGLGQQLLPTGTTRQASPEAQALAQRYQQAARGLAPTSYATSASPEAMAYANQLRGVAGQVMPTSYDTSAAAQQLLSQQQGLLQPGRERQLGQLREQLQRTGRSGFAVGQGGNLAAANPELAAYYNALAQQDAQLAASSQDRARAQLQQDIGLGTALGGQALTAQQQAEATSRQNMLQNLGLSLGFGTTGLGTATGAEELARNRFAQDIGLGQGLFGSGAQFLGQVPALQTQYLAPLQSQLGIVSNLEQLAQSPLDIGAQLGGRSAQAGTAQANALLQGGIGAAGTNLRAQQSVGSPVGQFLSGLGSNQQFTSGVSNWFGNLISGGGIGGGIGAGTPFGGFDLGSTTTPGLWADLSFD
jgi:hypothetical protein